MSVDASVDVSRSSPTPAPPVPPAPPAPLVLLWAIPPNYKSHHLRRFFSELVETGRFQCFHFRHRTTRALVETFRAAEAKESDPAGQEGQAAHGSGLCCVLRMAPGTQVPRLLADLNGQAWLNDREEEDPKSLGVARLRSLTLKEAAIAEILLAELKPPSVMPKGNVGTPTKYFLEAIQQCRLPAKIISKLKLDFPSTRRRRKYGSVAFQYEKGPPESRCWGASTYPDRSSSQGPRIEEEREDSAVDNDTCEEWERHEALNDDVSARRELAPGADIAQQPGTKERLFEEEMEVTWDKGSSGLVFYTDAQVWKQQQGDFDEQTADDWDVDMSVYYDESGGGDKDARDMHSMRREKSFAMDSSAESAFKKEPREKKKKRRRRRSPSDLGLGDFEQHTKGIGRKLMERQGWRQGRGLGSTFEGMSEALHHDGQTGRSGIGYRGEDLNGLETRKNEKKMQKRSDISQVVISTIFDKKDSVDPAPVGDRRNPDIFLTHRSKTNHQSFVKGNHK